MAAKPPTQSAATETSAPASYKGKNIDGKTEGDPHTITVQAYLPPVNVYAKGSGQYCEYCNRDTCNGESRDQDEESS